MKKFLWILFIILVLGIGLLFLIKNPQSVISQKVLPIIGLERLLTGETTTIANPASVFCVQNSGTSEIVTDSSGAQSGLCHLTDGTTCEEWAYFRGECPAPVTETTGTTEISGEIENIPGTLSYVNEEFGFNLQYPNTWEIQRWEDINSAHQDFSPMIFLERLYNKDEPFPIIVYNTTYSSFADFPQWHKTSMEDNKLKTSKQTMINKIAFIETIEIDGIDSSSIYFYTPHNNYTIGFSCENEKSKEILIKILETLKFTN